MEHNFMTLNLLKHAEKQPVSYKEMEGITKLQHVANDQPELISFEIHSFFLPFPFKGEKEQITLYKIKLVQFLILFSLY